MVLPGLSSILELQKGKELAKLFAHVTPTQVVYSIISTVSIHKVVDCRLNTKEEYFSLYVDPALKNIDDSFTAELSGDFINFSNDTTTVTLSAKREPYFTKDIFSGEKSEFTLNEQDIKIMSKCLSMIKAVASKIHSDVHVQAYDGILSVGCAQMMTIARCFHDIPSFSMSVASFEVIMSAILSHTAFLSGSDYSIKIVVYSKPSSYCFIIDNDYIVEVHAKPFQNNTFLNPIPEECAIVSLDTDIKEYKFIDFTSDMESSELLCTDNLLSINLRSSKVRQNVTVAKIKNFNDAFRIRASPIIIKQISRILMDGMLLCRQNNLLILSTPKGSLTYVIAGEFKDVL